MKFFVVIWLCAIVPVFAEEQPKAPEGMVYIPGGKYFRGNEAKLSQYTEFPEEAPVHEVEVSGFFMDVHEVTNAQFKKFVDATGYKTQAERGLKREDFPKAPEAMLAAGALVFREPPREVDVRRRGSHWQWWKFVPGASWKNPLGPGSDIKDKMNHPVVCVSWHDAQAYAKWAGKRLPTETEWERAARGGFEKRHYIWGNEKKPNGKHQANVFTGTFPHDNTATDGFKWTSPVKSYPANAYGLYDMAGNVWEHCEDLYRPDAYRLFLKAPVKNPKGPGKEQAVDEIMLNTYLRTGHLPKTKPHPLSVYHVVRGGSFLCHETYCLRYRPAARHHSEGLTPTNHTGFRCAMSIRSDQKSTKKP